MTENNDKGVVPDHLEHLNRASRDQAAYYSVTPEVMEIIMQDLAEAQEIIEHEESGK